MFDIYLRMINTKNNFYKSLLLMFKELLPLGSSKLKFKHVPNFNEFNIPNFELLYQNLVQNHQNLYRFVNQPLFNEHSLE